MRRDRAVAHGGSTISAEARARVRSSTGMPDAIRRTPSVHSGAFAIRSRPGATGAAASVIGPLPGAGELARRVPPPLPADGGCGSGLRSRPAYFGKHRNTA